MGMEKKFDFNCAGCGKKHTRSMWSVAHWNIEQVFKSDGCNSVNIIEADPTWLRKETIVRLEGGDENGAEFDELRAQGYQRTVPQGL